MPSKQRCHLLLSAPDVPEPTRDTLAPSILYSHFKRSISTLPAASIARDSALFTWPSPFVKAMLSEGFGGQVANLLTRRCISWQCDWCWPIALSGLALWQLAAMFWWLEPQSHAPWQQQNAILMPTIMENEFRKLMNKILFSVSFYKSDMLFCCPVSSCSFFFWPSSTVISPTLLLFLMLSEQQRQTLLISALLKTQCSFFWSLSNIPQILLTVAWVLCKTAMKTPSCFASTHFWQCWCHLPLYSLASLDTYFQKCLWLFCSSREVWAWFHKPDIQNAGRNLGQRGAGERGSHGVKSNFYFCLCS